MDRLGTSELSYDGRERGVVYYTLTDDEHRDIVGGTIKCLEDHSWRALADTPPSSPSGPRFSIVLEDGRTSTFFLRHWHGDPRASRKSCPASERACECSGIRLNSAMVAADAATAAVAYGLRADHALPLRGQTAVALSPPLPGDNVGRPPPRPLRDTR
jgi:hypothetical protein